MTKNESYTLAIKEVEFDLEEIISQDFIPKKLQDNLRMANLLFIPKIKNEKPYFEISTHNLYNYFRELESEGIKAGICIGTEDIRYFIKDSIEVYIALGWIFVEELVLRPLINKIKKIFKKKANEKIELKLTVSRPEKTLEIEFRGRLEDLDHILEKVNEF